MPAQERGPIGPSRNITRKPAFHRAPSSRGRYTERTISSKPDKQPAVNAIRRSSQSFRESARDNPQLSEREQFWTSQIRELRRSRQHSPREIDIFVGRALAHQEHEAEKAKNSSERDEGTGLYNRKGIAKRFSAVLSRAERTGEKISLALMDLDKFKDINDRYGHGCGDTVLKHTANHLRESGREHDIWGRIGGEEFIGIFLGENMQQAVRAMERQRIHLPEAVDKSLVKDGKFTVTRDITMSAGVVTFDLHAYEERFGTRPEQLRRILIKNGHNLAEMKKMRHHDRVAILQDAEQARRQTILTYLTEKADRALYKAKELGRDKVVAATENTEGKETFIEGRAMPAVYPIYDRMGR